MAAKFAFDELTEKSEIYKQKKNIYQYVEQKSYLIGPNVQISLSVSLKCVEIK